MIDIVRQRRFDTLASAPDVFWAFPPNVIRLQAAPVTDAWPKADGEHAALTLPPPNVGRRAMLAPGFFGKVPCRGDFIGRRLPPSFRQSWETWLASLAVAAHGALDADWPDAWLTAPLWHFGIGTALAPPGGAVGIVVASVDRADRCFPFSIIAAARPGACDEGGVFAWSRAAETLILAALDDGADPEALDAALVALGPPCLSTGPVHACGTWPLALDGDWPSPDPDPRLPSSRLPPGPDQSVWWCRGSARMPALHVRCDGLPGPRTTAAMITGAFEGPPG